MEVQKTLTIIPQYTVIKWWTDGSRAQLSEVFPLNKRTGSTGVLVTSVNDPERSEIAV